MRRQLKRVLALPGVPLCGGVDGTKPFPYDTLYVGLLLAQAVALAAWVAYGPI